MTTRSILTIGKDSTLTQPAPIAVPPSLSYAQALLAQLIAQGVRDVVVCPGSRSAPLAYALVQAERAGLIRLHVRIDERTAGFLALGLAKGSGVPAAVVTTSGTAVANLHPAVLEAHHSSIPLIVLSADRPHELRGTGANQTTNQLDLFGDSLRLLVDIGVPSGLPHESKDARAVAARGYASATGVNGRPGPVQLNLGFRDPLAPNAEQLAEIGTRFATPDTAIFLGGAAQTLSESEADSGEIDRGAIDRGAINLDAPTLIIAGDGASALAGGVALAQSWPIISEPSSGLAAHPNALPGGVTILTRGAAAPTDTDSPWTQSARTLTHQIKQVLVFGHPTLTRPVQQLIGREDVRTVVFPTHLEQWTDASRTADAILYAVPAWLLVPRTTGSTVLDEWRGVHQTLSEHLAGRMETLNDLTAPSAPMKVVRDLAATASAGDTLVFGASSPIRDADLYVTRWPAQVRVLAHRGLAGIDGTLSMALGIAYSARGRTRLMVGDLTFLHDAGALLHSGNEPAADLDIIVMNDNGGAIFGGLEHAAAGDSALYERVFGTPHTSDLAALCAGYSIAHRAIKTADDLAQFLAAPAAGIRVAEIQYGRAERSQTHKKLLFGL